MHGFFVSPDSYILARWIFLRVLGLVYLIAFGSFGVQITGLIGANGVLPVRDYMQRIRAALGGKGFWSFPTLAWISARDGFLKGICIAGIVLGLLLVFGFSTTPVLVLLWFGYLSLVVAGQVFLSFQWDVLLVEAGFLAIFLVPPSLLPGQMHSQPSHVVIFLFVWLLFRLMFMSGLLKWVSQDITWHSFTAMSYHYETQPLPTPPAWYMQKLPFWFQKFSTGFALFAEIFVPFLFFLPDPLREIGAALTILLQILILLTGNFAFFNWLAIFLCVFLLPDSVLHSLTGLTVPSLAGLAPAWGSVFPWILAVFFVPVGLVFVLLRFIRGSRFLHVIAPLLEYVQDWRLVNSYGLFVSMTTVHPEVIIEGSDDRVNWIPYEFRYKAGNPRGPLHLVAPHQPRLDWQMWFAALGTYNENPWFLHLIERLLEGSQPVLRLLMRCPFPDHPPKYIRAMLYDYKFTSFTERRETHDVWKRELLGMYLPPASLQSESSGRSEDHGGDETAEHVSEGQAASGDNESG